MRYVIFLALMAMGIGLVGAGSGGIKGAVFADAERLKQAIDERSDEVVLILEGILTQQQAADLEAALFPPATTAERKEALHKARTVLERAGWGEGDAVITALEAADSDL